MEEKAWKFTIGERRAVSRELCFFCWEISGVLENISDMWVNFTLGKEIQKLDQTLARDSFLAGCFEGVFALLFLILAFAGVVKITRVIRFWRIKRILGDRAMILWKNCPVSCIVHKNGFAGSWKK